MIENGFVLGDIKEYNEREILNFECNPQHKRVQELPSRCTKTGDRAEWIPAPECEGKHKLHTVYTLNATD